MARGRRHPPPLPNLVALLKKPGGSTSMETFFSSIQDALRKQSEFNRSLLEGFSGLPAPHAETHLVGKSDPLQTPGPPLTVTVGGSASIGSGPSFMREDAQLIVGAGTALGLANANVNGNLLTAARGDHQHKRDVRVKKGGSDVGTRNAIDFVDSGTLTWTVTDDSGGDKVTVSGTASGGGGGGSNDVDAKFLAFAAIAMGGE